MLTVGFTIIVSLLTGFWFMRKIYLKFANYWPSRKVEFTPVESIISRIATGNFSFIKQDVEMYTKLKEKGLTYGGYMELWNPIFFPVDLDLIKSIMIKDFDHFSDHRGFATPEEHHLYDNLFNSRGEAWKDLRVKMTPAFTTGKMRRMDSIFDSSSGKLVDVLKTKLGTSQSSTIVIRPHLQNVIMDLIINAAFGVQTDIFDNPKNSVFNAMGNKTLQTFSGLKSMIKLSIIALFPKTATFLKIRMMNKEADQFYSKIIRDVLHKRCNSSTKEFREDFMQIMIEAKNKNESDNSKVEMTEDLIIAQCIVFIIGGFDTTDALMSWATYELALNPEIQNKLYEEIKAGVERNGGTFSYDLVVNEFVYLDQIVQECLRKYPPIIRIDRRGTKTYNVPSSDLVLPKGSLVMIPVYAIHHDPNIYPDPGQFIPERFVKQNRPSCGFAPFGLGPRNCIGNRFALAEVKFVLAHLILNFELSPCSETKIPPAFVCGAALKPMDGLPLTVKRRN